MSSGRKDRAFYVVLTLLVLGFVVPATIPSTLAAYVAFASAIGSLVTLYFGANVMNKKVTQQSFIKQLELQHTQEDIQQEDRQNNNIEEEH
jgi:membrane protein YqaA with SNARE-associated domain